MKKIEYVYFVIGFSLIFFSFYLLFSRPLEVRILDVKFEVGDKIGITLNASELNFGRLLMGSSSVKNVGVSQAYDFPVDVKIFVSKNFKNFVFSDSEVRILEGETAVVPFTIVIPQDLEDGVYFGRVKFEFYKSELN